MPNITSATLINPKNEKTLSNEIQLHLRAKERKVTLLSNFFLQKNVKQSYIEKQLFQIEQRQERIFDILSATCEANQEIQQ